MGEVKKHGRVLGFHAGDKNIISELEERSQDGPQNLRLHGMARPQYVEMIVVQNATILSKASGCPLHICCLSIPEGIELIKKAKAKRVGILVESCAHYFLLNHEDSFGAGTCGLVQPPLRDRERVGQIQGYLLDGTIGYLNTDHTPYTEEDKEPEGGNRRNVMGGAPSIDIAYSLVISEAVIKRGVKVSRLADLCATDAAGRFGLYPRKGAIRVGADADLALVDVDCRWNCSRKDSLSKTKCISFPYGRREALCHAVETLVGGRTVYGDGVIWTVPGSRIFIRPQKGAIKMLGINRECLWERLRYVEGVRVDPRGGINRFVWTPTYREACEVPMGWMRGAGLIVWIDTVGNVRGKLEEQEDLPLILTDSHFDTVPMGGKFDELAGIMAAPEVFTTLSKNRIGPRRPTEMIAFVSEGASQSLGEHFGSEAICGILPGGYAATSTDKAIGTTMRQTMLDFDMRPEPGNFPGNYIKAGDCCAFIKLHIEQGCYLLHEDLPMTVVTDVTRVKRFYITLHGVSAHAGGITMENRHDTMAAATVIACKMRRLALEPGSTTRGTISYVEALPAEHNIVVNQAIVPVDFREKEDGLWQRLYDGLMVFAEKQCRDRELTYSVGGTINTRPVHCDERLMELIKQYAGKGEIPYKYMVSYPAHGAMRMRYLYPMGMIFLRDSNERTNHCPSEHIAPRDMVDNTTVPLGTVECLVQEGLLG